MNSLGRTRAGDQVSGTSTSLTDSRRPLSSKPLLADLQSLPPSQTARGDQVSPGSATRDNTWPAGWLFMAGILATVVALARPRAR